MSIKKILVSQPRPTSEKSPYFDLEKKYGVEIVFRPFIKVEGLSSKEFRQSKINVPDYSAIILTARTAIDHFFRLCKELRYNVPDTLKYFCVSETIAHYLQKYVIYRKRKIFYSETGLMEDLIPIIAKHHKETYLMPVSDVHNDKAVVLDNNKVKYVKAVMYRTVSNDFKPGEQFDYDMLVFFTPAGIKSYTTNFPDYMERNVVIAAMGQTTLEAATQAGLKVDITIKPETPSMASAIEQYLKKAKAEEEKAAAKAAREAVKVKPAATKKAASKKAAAKKPLTEEELFAKRSKAAKKAAATRRAKAKAAKAAAKKLLTEEELFAKRSAAAKKAAATRRAKAKAAKAAAKKAVAQSIKKQEQQTAQELFAKRSEAAKKAAATRKAKAEAEKAAAAKRSAAAKKAAATRKAKAEAAKKKKK
ncbi:MAG: uroporphyrinogen-III synthase [Muribaculaceae bacterium]|nr:uroporphyrinogen-III synthase [Muribaculaceae bacterium]